MYALTKINEETRQIHVYIHIHTEIKEDSTYTQGRAEHGRTVEDRTGQDTQRDSRIHLLASVRKFSEDIPMSVTGSNRGIF
jgi:hypothetical protein